MAGLENYRKDILSMMMQTFESLRDIRQSYKQLYQDCVREKEFSDNYFEALVNLYSKGVEAKTLIEVYHEQFPGHNEFDKRLQDLSGEIESINVESARWLKELLKSIPRLIED